MKYALAELAAGKTPSGKELLPGVLTWAEYQHRLATWDAVRACVGIHAQFWKGRENLLYPPAWLNNAEDLWRKYRSQGVYELSRFARERRAEGVGVDPAEGGDSTVFVAVDRWGVLEILSDKTPDTNVISGNLLAFVRKWGCPDEGVCIDRGGGGKELADRVRAQGIQVRTVAFGESVALEPRRGRTPFADRTEAHEEKYVYLNRRAQMYHNLSLLLDPASPQGGFGLPPADAPEGGRAAENLRKQLAVIPRLLDDEGRYWLPSKGNVTEQMRRSRQKTLIEMIGHSPDEADALVLAVHGMTDKGSVFIAGAR